MPTGRVSGFSSGFLHIGRLVFRRAVGARVALPISAVCLCTVVLAQRSLPGANPRTWAASAAGQVWTNSSLPGSQVIQHVVILFQENRSPDNLFQDPVLIQRGADIRSYGINSKHRKIPLQPRPLADYYDLGHGHSQFLSMYDGGKMDGADKNNQHCDSGHL